MLIKKLLTTTNAKTSKGEKLGYLTGILYMNPAFGPGDGRNLCPWSTAGCRAGCLVTAGRGAFDSVAAGRARKRREFLTRRREFVAQLAHEIPLLERRARRAGLRAVVRLNGTTDLAWHKIAPQLFTDNPRVIFYDYTKSIKRILADELPVNYDLTFSRSEHNEEEAREALRRGRRVAVVFSTKRGGKLPAHFMGARVIDGDRHDLRFLDRGAVVVGLTAKGKARRDSSGFVIDVKTLPGMGD